MSTLTGGGWFREGLANLGHREGETVILDLRSALGDNTRLPALARELSSRKPTMILSTCGGALKAIREVNQTIPVVAVCADFKNFHDEVKSLRRPGGATTGLLFLSSDSAGKRLELLKEIHTGLTRVAVLYPSADEWPDYWVALERAAPALGITLLKLPPVDTADDLETALAGAIRGRSEALLVLPGTATMGAAARIASFAIQHRMLSAFDIPIFADAGGLIYYGADFRELGHVAARYVDRVLKGASPAELPIVHPTKFELIVNLKTAKALGITIPRSILNRADRVIE